MIGPTILAFGLILVVVLTLVTAPAHQVQPRGASRDVAPAAPAPGEAA